MTAITIQKRTPKGERVAAGSGRQRVEFAAPVDLEPGDVVYVRRGGRVLCVIRTTVDERTVYVGE